jgi:hypothetical protein
MRKSGRDQNKIRTSPPAFRVEGGHGNVCGSYRLALSQIKDQQPGSKPPEEVDLFYATAEQLSISKFSLIRQPTAA